MKHVGYIENTIEFSYEDCQGDLENLVDLYDDAQALQDNTERLHEKRINEIILFASLGCKNDTYGVIRKLAKHIANLELERNDNGYYSKLLQTENEVAPF